MKSNCDLTAEQLSRVLSEHEAGLLQRGGAVTDYGAKWCVLQAAFNISNSLNVINDDPERTIRDQTARDHLDNLIDWFDQHYNPEQSSERFLREILRHV